MVPIPADALTRKQTVLRKNGALLFRTLLSASAVATFYAETTFFKRAYHDSILTGKQWVQELLQGNPNRIKDQLGMGKHVFQKLIQQLYSLTSVNHTRHVDLEEQVAIFLFIIVTNLSNRKVAECFQRSGDTISKCGPLFSYVCIS